MNQIKTANAPGRHPRGIPDKTHVDSALSSTLVDKLIDLQDTITAALTARKIHAQGNIDELFFQAIRRDAGFLLDRIAAFGMDDAAESAGETGGEE